MALLGVVGVTVAAAGATTSWYQYSLAQTHANWASQIEAQREAERSQRMQQVASLAHDTAAEAFSLAEMARRQAADGHHRAATQTAIRAMERTRDAHRVTLREHPSVLREPCLSSMLHPGLADGALVMWEAVAMYNAASALLHTLEAEAVTFAGGKASSSKRRAEVRSAVEEAKLKLAQAQARAAHPDGALIEKWEPGLRSRIALRLADATSYERTLLGDPAKAAQAYDRTGVQLALDGGEKQLEAQLKSNHAMALFGLATKAADAKAVQQLKNADDLFMRAQGAPKGPPIVDHRACSTSEAAFDVAIQTYISGEASDRQRILHRKRLTVPSMLLLVASLEGSEDLVALLDLVADRARDFAQAHPSDKDWLAHNGAVRVLVAVSVALEHCATDDVAATEALADDAIRVAAKLTTTREKPGKAAGRGDFGAFACTVAQNRPPASGWAVSPPWRPVQFSELARAKRMEREAMKLREGRPSTRRSTGQVLDGRCRAKLRQLVREAEAQG